MPEGERENKDQTVRSKMNHRISKNLCLKVDEACHVQGRGANEIVGGRALSTMGDFEVSMMELKAHDDERFKMQLSFSCAMHNAKFMKHFFPPCNKNGLQK